MKINKIFWIILLISLGYVFGSLHTEYSYGKKALDEYYWRVSKIPDFELDFLKSLNGTTSNKLKSGEYSLEVWLPGQEPKISTVTIPFKDGQFNFRKPKELKRNGMVETAKIEFPAVSWHTEGMFYDPGISYVGVVTEEMMWGRVYAYGQESNEEVGFWKMYPKKLHR